jgi:predicted TIM-barrel fold metal-dependent hydrolase
MIIDADTHLDEFDELWSEYSPSKNRELALTVTYDKGGYAWLNFQGRPLMMMDRFLPGDFERAGRERAMWRAGDDIAPELRREERPPDYSDAAQRIARMDEWGIDRSVMYPNFGFIWEAILYEDLDATRVNCAAWNRWAADLTREHKGRVMPVGHLVVQGSTDWVESQLKLLAGAGVRQAMFSPGLINGQRMSHPDNDRLWSLFVQYGITPAWHIDGRSFTAFADHDAWTSNDRDSRVRLLPLLFSNVIPQMGLADLAANGVFERFPELRVVVAEIGANWFPELMRRIDNLWTMVDQVHGRPLNDLPKKPSEYLRERTLVTCSFSADASSDLVAKYPGSFAFGTDYPHPEGLAGGVREYESRMGALPDDHRGLFYGGNIGSVLAG